MKASRGARSGRETKCVGQVHRRVYLRVAALLPYAHRAVAGESRPVPPGRYSNTMKDMFIAVAVAQEVQFAPAPPSRRAEVIRRYVSA